MNHGLNMEFGNQEGGKGPRVGGCRLEGKESGLARALALPVGGAVRSASAPYL